MMALRKLRILYCRLYLAEGENSALGRNVCDYFFLWLEYYMPMKKIVPLTSACVFAICACLALTAPLYAGDESFNEAGQAASTVIKSTVTPSQGQVAAQEVKQNVIQKIVPNKTQVKVVSVDFNILKERLKNTDAIGFFTKLAIRNDIVDLMDKIKKYRKKAKLKVKMNEIRSSFDGLLLKIIALLEGDPNLSRDLYVGRESIWESLLEVKA
ncbi:MAG: hypothetical protein Q9M82_00265 [Mariprofundus sp.]|nr:hypothetical protein [Mariprofundus sp.]